MGYKVLMVFLLFWLFPVTSWAAMSLTVVNSTTLKMSGSWPSNQPFATAIGANHQARIGLFVRGQTNYNQRVALSNATYEWYQSSQVLQYTRNIVAQILARSDRMTVTSKLNSSASYVLCLIVDGTSFCEYGSAGVTNPVEPPVTCSTTDTTIDHGSVKPSEISGHTRSTMLAIRCTGAASVRVKASSYSASSGLKLGSGAVTSFLTLNGNSAEVGTGYMSVNTGTQVTVTSVLVPAGAVPPGVYSGSIVLVTDMQ